jgi:MOSC domain-containing protein YiiM
MISVVSVQIGRVAPLGPRRVPSGFVKTPVAGPVAVSPRGLDGDQQADLTVHGDAAKAVYGYADESYALWRQTHPQHAALWQPGGVGENLTIAGATEDDTCIGDVVQAGSAVLQVTQPREPCSKFAARFGDSKLPKAMVANGLCGWYFRVITPGAIAAGDAMRVTDRPNPHWPVSRMARLIHAKWHDPDELAELAALPGLAETWVRRLA